MRQFLQELSVLLLALLTGCVSYPVTEFRGITVNITGNGRTESGTHEIGAESSGPTFTNSHFFALGLGNGATFQILYPAGETLQRVAPDHVRTFLIREPVGQRTWMHPAATNAKALSRVIELEGHIEIKFRDNTQFTIRVHLKSKGTEGVAIDGEFVCYHQRSFEPGTYAAATAMLLGVSEGAMGHSRSSVQHGDLALLRKSVAGLVAKRRPSSLEVSLLSAGHCLTFSNTIYFKDRKGVRLSFPVDSHDATLRSSMFLVCQEIGLEPAEAASIDLANPTVEVEPHWLSVDIYGPDAGAVAELAATIVKRVFNASDESAIELTLD